MASLGRQPLCLGEGAVGASSASARGMGRTEMESSPRRVLFCRRSLAVTPAVRWCPRTRSDPRLDGGMNGSAGTWAAVFVAMWVRQRWLVVPAISRTRQYAATQFFPYVSRQPLDITCGSSRSDHENARATSDTRIIGKRPDFPVTTPFSGGIVSAKYPF